MISLISNKGAENDDDKPLKNIVAVRKLVIFKLAVSPVTGRRCYWDGVLTPLHYLIPLSPPQLSQSGHLSSGARGGDY